MLTLQVVFNDGMDPVIARAAFGEASQQLGLLTEIRGGFAASGVQGVQGNFRSRHRHIPTEGLRA